MSVAPRDFEMTWLREIERRLSAGEGIDYREMMVTLRDRLPRGFKPSDIDGRLLHGLGLSVDGLAALGDSGKLLPDLEKAIRFVQDRLIQYPALATVKADEVAAALTVSASRAEQILLLLGSLGNFWSGASGGNYGYSEIQIGRDDIVSTYLAFSSLSELLERRAANIERGPPGQGPPGSSFPRPQARTTTAFILMNMDPQDAGLEDVRAAIKEECAAFGIQAVRIDEIEHQERITDRILALIATSDLIIADLSGERPNVYYEVGYAHAINKHPILFRKTGTRLHFDLSVHNVPEYKNIVELRGHLHRRLEALLGRSPAAGVSARGAT